MLFPSCRRILLFLMLSLPHGPNKVVLDPSCTWIRCTKVSSWYSNGPFNSDLVETFKTNTFNASFNAFILDRVIGPFGTCNGSLLVFLGWSTSATLLSNLIYLAFWELVSLRVSCVTTWSRGSHLQEAWSRRKPSVSLWKHWLCACRWSSKNQARWQKQKGWSL